MDNIGEKIHSLATKLWPINRSLTGDGVRETLAVLHDELPELQIREVPSGTKVFDWNVPKEWRVRQAWVLTPGGQKICDFSVNNLHLVGYSTPIHTKLSLEELDEHLHSLPDQPNAIPYVTSYYSEGWGFCISQEQRDHLVEGDYEVFIDSELFEGSLTYGELLIKGDVEKEVFISTYICHPSMANNELSGPTVTVHLAQWLSSLKKRKYSYRIVFIPETIGSITYLSLNQSIMKKNIIAGFNVSCVGDDRTYSYLPSRKGDTRSDAVAKHVLKHTYKNFHSYKWADRGSDERQYCAPNIDLPIASIMRSKYGEYPEYHTSLDDLVNVVTPAGLEGGYEVLRRALEAIERDSHPIVTVSCEPQLGKRGMYPTYSTKESYAEISLMMDLISWSDGATSLLEIAEIFEVPIWDLYPIVDVLVEHHLLEV